MSAAETRNWFDVDVKGLAKLIERRGGKAWLLYELIQNAWDADGTTRVDVKLDPEEGVPRVWVTVTDDAPEGFPNLMHAWTLFASNGTKLANAGKRGRWVLGEKLVLALCDEAQIVTTSGGVQFDKRGRTSMRGPSSKRERGSEFTGYVRMTRAELVEVRVELTKLIPPAGIETYIDGVLLAQRTPIRVLQATLPTVVADAEGALHRTARQCEVHIYEPLLGETASLYELGIPVVETGDRWHVDVLQRVPLNMDRDNVTPAYLRELRTLVVNALHDQLNVDDANATFVNEVLAAPDASSEAVNTALDLKYGTKRAVFDPSDLEANMNLVGQGYTLIKGAQLTKPQWENVRKHGAAVAAGRIAPTPKALFGPDGDDTWVPREKWTPAMHAVTAYAWEIGAHLLGHEITIGILSDIRLRYAACFGGDRLTFNLGKLGHAFFDACKTGPTPQLNELLLHELAHYYADNHLDEKFHQACCALGARLVTLALANPELFRWDVEA